MKTTFTKIILYGYLVIFTIISISSLGYYLDSINPTTIHSSITCYNPTSEKPHEDAAWNLDDCYWFVDDPHTPYVTVVFSDFAYNFSTCSSAIFNLTVITHEGDPIYVTANITDDCKIHVTEDMRERPHIQPNRKLLEAQCDNLILEEDFMDFKNCTMNKTMHGNMHGSVRLWKSDSYITTQPFSEIPIVELYAILVEDERKKINSIECSELFKKYDGKMHTISWDVHLEFISNAMDKCKDNSSMIGK